MMGEGLVFRALVMLVIGAASWTFLARDPEPLTTMSVVRAVSVCAIMVTVMAAMQSFLSRRLKNRVFVSHVIYWTTFGAMLMLANAVLLHKPYSLGKGVVFVALVGLTSGIVFTVLEKPRVAEACK